ncbi:MAG: hypothetical protein RIQ81_1520 [Pseudomonadota bacterium]
MSQWTVMLLNGLAWLSLGMLIVAAIMAVLNAIFTGRLRLDAKPVADGPLVSVLIPVRNESDNLRNLLPALMATTFKNIEVIVLDDESTDGSHEIAFSILQNASFPAQVVNGQPWSPSLGLSGKTHACAQLAELARGEILIFCDADVLPSPDAVGLTSAHLSSPGFRDHAAGLSALPGQSCRGWRERSLIPWVMHLPLMITVPLFCSWRLPTESIQIANGQWLALYARDYIASGGHRALGATPLEDVTLARQVQRKTGRGVRPVFAASDITAAMYVDWHSMVNGFSKNLVSIGGGTPGRFLAVIMLLNIVFLFPMWGWLVQPGLAATGLLACVLLRLVTATVFKMPAWDLLRHPASLFLLDLAAWKAIKTSLRGAYEWKDRVVKWSAT